MEQYDVSPEMKKLYEIKKKQRAADKEYFHNILYNPRRPTDIGAPFDPALFRYSATMAYHLDIFNKTTKGYFKFVAWLSPIFICYYFVKDSRKKKEALYKSGVISFEDRQFKLFI